MPKVRNTTQNDIHKFISKQTLFWSSLNKDTWREYLSRFGLHHVTQTQGPIGLLQACSSIEFMANYIQTWISFTQPLKICRIIGMNVYVNQLNKTLGQVQPSQDTLQHLILVNSFLVAAQEPTNEVVALSERLYTMTTGIDLTNTSHIRLHRFMGLLYRKINRFEEAQTHLQKAIQIGRDNNLLLDSDCMEARNELSILVSRTGQFESGMKLMETVYRDSLKQYGPHFPLTLATQTSLAWYAHQMGDLDAAESQYKEVLAIIKKAQKSDIYIQYMNAMIGLAETTTMKGNTQEAFELLNDLQKNIRTELGTRTFIYGQVSNQLALCSVDLEYYDKAKEIFLELISYTKTQTVPVPMYFVNIAVVCMHQENLEEAEGHMAEANRLALIHWPAKCPDFLVLKQNMARLKMHQKKFNDAINISHELLQLQIEAHGESHFLVTFSYASLAYLYDCINDIEQSFLHNKLTYESGVQTLGKTHHYVCDALYEVANYYESQDQYQEMETILEDGCAPLLEKPERITRSNVYNLFLLGRATLTLEKYEKAIELYTTLLSYEQGIYGTDHIELATTHFYLAKCHMACGSIQETIVHRSTCFELNQSENGIENSDTISVGLHLVKDLHNGGQVKEAQSLLNRLKVAIQNLQEPDDDLFVKWTTTHDTLFI
jgi:tetratricopeptide (TPR) repeat protein